MNKYLLGVAIGISVLFGIASCLPAQAQVQAPQQFCVQYPEMISKLKKDYNEESVSIGMISSELIIEILTSPEGETFSIIMVDTKGLACLVSVGEHFQTRVKTPPASIPNKKGSI